MALFWRVVEEQRRSSSLRLKLSLNANSIRATSLGRLAVHITRMSSREASKGMSTRHKAKSFILIRIAAADIVVLVHLVLVAAVRQWAQYLQTMASLSPAVSSLRSSLSLLQSSISILDEGVSDFPRLCKVLQTEQHFELLPEPTLREAQQSLLDEITPAIGQLLSTAENYVNQLGRREESLKARCELLEGRLSHGRRNSSLGGGRSVINSGQTGQNGGRSDAKMLEMKRLRQKKDRLQYAVERLELQSKQRERELRKSMAVVKD